MRHCTVLSVQLQHNVVVPCLARIQKTRRTPSHLTQKKMTRFGSDDDDSLWLRISYHRLVERSIAVHLGFKILSNYQPRNSRIEMSLISRQKKFLHFLRENRYTKSTIMPQMTALLVMIGEKQKSAIFPNCVHFQRQNYWRLSSLMLELDKY